MVPMAYHPQDGRAPNVSSAGPRKPHAPTLTRRGISGHLIECSAQQASDKC